MMKKQSEKGYDADTPIQQSISKNLSDKLYEKRKLGALEVEQLIKELNAQNDRERISSVITHLVKNFSDSAQGNSRKGGLIALAATAIGLGADTDKYVQQLVPPVLKCFIDQDHRVRYYACESLYNIAKVARGNILIFFNEIFDSLCKLSADADVNVKNGAQLLDRLVKDIVTESTGFNIERFIPLLQERVYVINPYCRRFLIAWVMVLDSVPDVDMLKYLPKFLDGIFNMLKDNNQDIRQEAEACLAEFLREIRANPAVIDFASMVKILISHGTSRDEFTRLTAIQWINEFVLLGKASLLTFSAQLIAAVLPCLSHDVQEIKQAAYRANGSMLRLIAETKEKFPMSDVMTAVTHQFTNPNVPTRLAALQWIVILHNKTPSQLAQFVDDLFPVLLRTLSDPSEQVVRLDIEVMAKIAQLDEAYFTKLMNSLVSMFEKERSLLEKRGSLIIRQFTQFISPEKMYVSLAGIIESRKDAEFATVMVQTLNLILLTSAELYDVRTRLKTLRQTNDKQSKELFEVLYKCWAHNPAATFSLCLLSQLYHHASVLIKKYGELEITVFFLLEMDRLVQLLESPIFLYLRLQLLEPETYPYLFQSLYGLLMVLPQTAAFQTLRNRLNSVSALTTGVQKKDDNSEAQLGINFSQLLDHFMDVQETHAKYRRARAAEDNELVNP